MARPAWFSTAVLLVLALGAPADHEGAKEAAKHPALERLKKLAGTWVAVGKDGKPTDKIVSVFKVTSAGSAVHETIFPGEKHEMVTVYHLDGKDLVLTHYCSLGNQPRLKLDPKSSEKELVFKFAGGSNLDPQKDMHMHEGAIKILDADRIQWTWQGYDHGKAAEGHKISLTLVRKKS